MTTTTIDTVAKAALAAELKSIGGKRAALPSTIIPMLASKADEPFQQLGWLYEPKLDGVRCIAIIRNGKATLHSRNGLDLTPQYPAVARGIASAIAMDGIIDGELVALDEDGRPSFQMLQQRMNLVNETDVRRAEINIPVLYFAFDLLHLGDYSLMNAPLEQRKHLLESVLLPCTHVQVTSHFVGDGRAVYDACMSHGFEGMVAKRMDSVYEQGKRSPNWVKIKAHQISEFVIAGYTIGQGDRNNTFGALLLGHYDGNGNLLYVGSVGTGFTDRILEESSKSFERLRVDTCPFKSRPADKPSAVWLAPEMVGEIKFMEWTNERRLRAPVFRRFRPDLVHKNIRQIRSVSLA